MSHKCISNKVKLEGKKISSRTIQRWFNFLKQRYPHPKSKTHEKFNFYPTFFYEKLGLTPLYVISEKPSLKLLRKFPLQYYQDYIAWLYDFHLRDSVLLNGYLVPNNYLKKFEKAWDKIKEEGVISNYEIYPTNKGFNIYSSWHKTIDNQGLFHPEKNIRKEIETQIQEFKDYLKNLPKFEMIPEVNRNPLIIPTLFEYRYECKSSYQVWQAIKTNLGEKVWKYITKKKEPTDWIGIKKVQGAIKDIHKFKLFHKMRVDYMPIELNHNFFIYLILKFKNKKETVDNIRRFSMQSIYLNILPQKNNQIFLIALINNKSLEKFFNILKTIDVKRMLFLQHERSLPLLTTDRYKKFNYSKLFDPKKKQWLT
jgi:hypothetical protein